MPNGSVSADVVCRDPGAKRFGVGGIPTRAALAPYRSFAAGRAQMYFVGYPQSASE